MNKNLLLILLLIQHHVFSQSNNDLQIIDLSQMQIRLLNKGKTMDSATKTKMYADSLYRPYKEFWSGYAGEEEVFLQWMNREGVVFLDYLNERNKAIDGEQLLIRFNEIKENMIKLTGYSPKGKWYIVYFHGATDLGGLGGGTMLIDLSHEHNNSNENITALFPHEITHQVMNTVNKNEDVTALNSIIGEGFAVYINQLYWGNKFSLAQNLGYSENELKECFNNPETIKQFFDKNKFSTDADTIFKFRNRSVKITPALPGAIGYYIGYEIVKKYAEKYSWKDVFTKPAREIYELSGY